ncbi:MAG TPA: NAD+ synthase [Enhygromyxa sp.]|nr:NAD+ synthase [Enhygromyxa sp.]
MTADALDIAVAQLNPVVGDIAGNLALAKQAVAEAGQRGADLVLFTECFLSGYPPEDLVMKPAFLADCEAAVHTLARETSDGPGIIIGVPLQRETGRHNAAVVIDRGRVVGECYKVDLPNYGEFDEKRVFVAGPPPRPVDFRGVRIGVPICEDIWGDLGVCKTLADAGAELLLVPNGSPYHRGKIPVRREVVLRQVAETKLAMIYANQVGGQDELVFDGASFAIDVDQTLVVQMAQFEPQLQLTHWQREAGRFRQRGFGLHAELPDPTSADYRACMLGLRDYVNKNGFEKVLLGLSGGVDSAICAALAVDALGPERVWTIMLPYKYTASSSLTDAQACAKALGCRYDVVPIGEPVEGFKHALAELFAGTREDVTEENLQSRARGTMLMALSNKFGAMVVTTGNKSEVSVGYSTLYGDMNGGFNPIKDLYKMQVYALCRWRNANVPAGALGPAGEVIPQSILAKAPSAELRAGQVDQDSLPPYPVLDDILECLVENEMGVDEIVARGHDRALVHRIEHMLYTAEYKRRQAAPGVKITRKHFGRDRRYPITNRYRDV